MLPRMRHAVNQDDRSVDRRCFDDDRYAASLRACQRVARYREGEQRRPAGAAIRGHAEGTAGDPERNTLEFRSPRAGSGLSWPKPAMLEM